MELHARPWQWRLWSVILPRPNWRHTFSWIAAPTGHRPKRDF